MSTRSCIILKVRKEDKGKTIKFKETSLPVMLDTWQERDFNGNVWRDETGKNLCKPVWINYDYIGIYCHWDGYPSGVGEALKEHFTDYKSVLNLILGGSCSSIDEKVRHYANRQGEEWKHLVARQGNTQKKVIEHFRDAWAEYAYLYDETRGGWFYKPLFSENYAKKGFKKLK